MISYFKNLLKTYIPFLKIKHLELRYKNKYIFYCYGSTSDMFMIGSLLSSISEKYGEIIIICNIIHEDIFRIYINNNLVKIHFINEKWNKYFIHFLRKKSEISKIYKGKLIQSNFNFYYNIPTICNLFEIEYKKMIELVFNLPENIQQSYPIYNDNDKYIVNNLIKEIKHDPQKIILINPIALTHFPLSSEIWNFIAKVFSNNGYYPVFNVKNTPNKLNFNSNFYSNYKFNYPTIEIPAHLVPLFSEQIFAGCARMGGGFDLLCIYSKMKVRTILIRLDDSFDIDLNSYRKENSYNSTNLYLTSFKNEIEINNNDLVLTKNESNLDLELKIKNSLNFQN
jgi:hypothetical protein